MNPRNFKEIEKKGLEPTAFQALSEKLIAFEPEATPDQLRRELKDLAFQRKHVDSVMYVRKLLVKDLLVF